MDTHCKFQTSTDNLNFKRDSKENMHACVPSRVLLFATPWTIVHEASLSMGSSRQEYWSGLPFPPPRDLSDPGIDPVSLASSELAGGFFITKLPGKPRKRTPLYNPK